jgi:two-component sensor histidine kinase
VSLARRFVVGSIADFPDETKDALALVVSELATNCVLHAKTHFQIRIQRTQDGLRLEVTDRAGGEVGVRHPASTETRGRGLQLVDHTVGAWGVTYSPDGAGKTVWCTFSVPAERTATTAGSTSGSGS